MKYRWIKRRTLNTFWYRTNITTGVLLMLSAVMSAIMCRFCAAVNDLMVGFIILLLGCQQRECSKYREFLAHLFNLGDYDNIGRIKETENGYDITLYRERKQGDEAHASGDGDGKEVDKNAEGGTE